MIFAFRKIGFRCSRYVFIEEAVEHEVLDEAHDFIMLILGGSEG